MSRFFPTPADCGKHVIFGSVHIRTFAGEHLQLSLVDIPANGVVDWHSHPNEQMGMLVKGSATFYIGDEVKVLGPGAQLLGDITDQPIFNFFRATLGHWFCILS